MPFDILIESNARSFIGVPVSRLIHLIYNSAAAVEFSDDDLAALLNQARNKNASLGITGMLLHVDGCFFQLLEGPEESVKALAAMIERDPRHSRMTTIICEPIARRSFSEWSMGFTRMSANAAKEMEGLNDFFGGGRVLTDLDQGRARKLLTAFKEGRWRVQLSARATKPVMDQAVNNQPNAVSVGDPRPAFSFAFQPIVDASTRRVAGYEALVRGAEGGTAAEVLQRIPLGEISSFDEDGRRMAIGMATRMGVTGNLHLNIIPQIRVGEPTALESTLETAKRCGLDASRIVLQIKHEATVTDAEALSVWLSTYRSHGLKISIDDFGSGHAGLALLDHYQPELISLSTWLVRGIESHGPRQAILRGLIQTCADLGIDVIAKGVETTEEYEWLRNEGLTLFQGYLFAKPGFEHLPRPMLPAESL
jgi:blue light- and temperature-responsive anti-repressor